MSLNRKIACFGFGMIFWTGITLVMLPLLFDFTLNTALDQIPEEAYRIIPVHERPAFTLQVLIFIICPFAGLSVFMSLLVNTFLPETRILERHTLQFLTITAFVISILSGLTFLQTRFLTDNSHDYFMTTQALLYNVIIMSLCNDIVMLTIGIIGYRDRFLPAPFAALIILLEVIQIILNFAATNPDSPPLLFVVSTLPFCTAVTAFSIYLWFRG